MPSGVPYWTDLLDKNPDPTSFTLPPDAWSVVFMGLPLRALPGLLEDGDVIWKKHPHRVIDRGRKPATDGATPKLLGFGISEFDLKLILTTRQQLETLTQVLPQVWQKKSSSVTITPNSGTSVTPGNGIPGAQFVLGLNLTQGTPGGGSSPKGNRDKPIFVYHPALAMDGITQCVVEGWTPPRRYQGKNDMKYYVLHCIEYNDAKARQATTPKQISQTDINTKTLPPRNAQTPPSAGPEMTL